VAEYPFIPYMTKVLRQIDPDLIHAHSHLFLTTYQAVRSASKQKKPLVVTVHGLIAKRQSILNLAQKVYLYTLASNIFKKATIVICLTRSDALEVMKLGCPREKIRILPNPVDTELFVPKSDMEESNLIVWIGRFVPEKGVHVLINAAKKVVNQRNDVKFLLVGDGPLKQKMIFLVKTLKLEKYVAFRGSVPHEEVPKFLQKSTLVVIPSLREGMPFILLEAMACGKPVVGSNIPGIKDVITHLKNGLSVPPGDSEALANAIMFLLENEDIRKNLGRNARQLMVEKYNWDKYLKKIQYIYKEAIIKASSKD
jgi:glycosyltransferase involved in cell wall biosynthesis